MIVCTASNNIISEIDKFFSHSLAIFYYILDIFFILIGHGFFCTNCFCSDNMHQRPTLSSGKYRTINFLCKFRFAENQSASRPTQSLMCGSGNNVCNSKRRRMNASSNQTSNMGHINHEIGLIIFIKCNISIKADSTNNLFYFVEIYNSTICASTSKNKFRLIISDFIFKIIIINEAIAINAIEYYIICLAAEIDRRTMSKMATIFKAHCQDCITMFQNCRICCHICLRARMGLNIYMIICIKYFLPKFTTILFNFIYILTAAIISAVVSSRSITRIALGIFISQATTHCFQNIIAYKILACNKLNIFFLAFFFCCNQIKNFFVQFMYILQFVILFNKFLYHDSIIFLYVSLF